MAYGNAEHLEELKGELERITGYLNSDTTSNKQKAYWKEQLELVKENIKKYEKLVEESKGKEGTQERSARTPQQEVQNAQQRKADERKWFSFYEMAGLDKDAMIKEGRISQDDWKKLDAIIDRYEKARLNPGFYGDPNKPFVEAQQFIREAVLKEGNSEGNRNARDQLFSQIMKAHEKEINPTVGKRLLELFVGGRGNNLGAYYNGDGTLNEAKLAKELGLTAQQAAQIAKEFNEGYKQQFDGYGVQVTNPPSQVTPGGNGTGGGGSTPSTEHMVDETPILDQGPYHTGINGEGRISMNLSQRERSANKYQRLADRLNNQVYFRPGKASWQLGDALTGGTAGAFGGRLAEIYQMPKIETEDMREQSLARQRENDRIVERTLNQPREVERIKNSLIQLAKTGDINFFNLLRNNREALSQRIRILAERLPFMEELQPLQARFSQMISQVDYILGLPIDEQQKRIMMSRVVGAVLDSPGSAWLGNIMAEFFGNQYSR